MGDEGTASTLVYAGAIIQLIFAIIFLVLAGLVFVFLLPLTFDPMFAYLFWGIAIVASSLLAFLGIIDLIFVFLWFKWRHEPSEHRTGLIATGIIGLLFTGFIPGLLVLIGGAIAEEPATFVAGAPSWTPTPTKGVRYCPVCGTQIESGDQYCSKCGASLSR
jgi:hypothetical protein